MKTYMTKYLVTYWAERNDEATDVEIIVEANNKEEAFKIFLDMNKSYRRIESIEEMV
jgi:hypothetical protein